MYTGCCTSFLTITQSTHMRILTIYSINIYKCLMWSILEEVRMNTDCGSLYEYLTFAVFLQLHNLKPILIPNFTICIGSDSN